MSKLCGNPECAASSFEDIPTFGSGEMDQYGFFEKPCWICARKFEELEPGMGPCWPFSDEYLNQEKLIDLVPDKFKLNLIGNLTKVNPDEMWLLGFSREFPDEYSAYLDELRS